MRGMARDAVLSSVRVDSKCTTHMGGKVSVLCVSPGRVMRWLMTPGRLCTGRARKIVWWGALGWKSLHAVRIHVGRIAADCKSSNTGIQSSSRRLLVRPALKPTRGAMGGVSRSSTRVMVDILPCLPCSIEICAFLHFAVVPFRFVSRCFHGAGGRMVLVAVYSVHDSVGVLQVRHFRVDGNGWVEWLLC